MSSPTSNRIGGEALSWHREYGNKGRFNLRSCKGRHFDEDWHYILQARETLHRWAYWSENHRYVMFRKWGYLLWVVLHCSAKGDMIETIGSESDETTLYVPAGTPLIRQGSPAPQHMIIWTMQQSCKAPVRSTSLNVNSLVHCLASSVVLTLGWPKPEACTSSKRLGSWMNEYHKIDFIEIRCNELARGIVKKRNSRWIRVSSEETTTGSHNFSTIS